MIRIEPLIQTRLEEAINLVNLVFPEEIEEPPGEEIPASLEPEKYQDFLLKYQMSDIRYWLAIDGSDKVAGTVCLYCYEADKAEAFWLGWFCVHPEVRNNGIGTALLRFAINKARTGSKKFLRLYTSTEPNELDAHRLYEKHGFKLTGREPYLDSDAEKLYYELKL